MRYILAATGDKAAAGVIRSAFRRPFQVDRATTVREGLESLRKRRNEFAFLDLELLYGLGGVGDDAAAALRTVRQLFPSVEIIVMASPEGAGEAVEARLWAILFVAVDEGGLRCAGQVQLLC